MTGRITYAAVDWSTYTPREEVRIVLARHPCAHEGCPVATTHSTRLCAWHREEK